MNCFVNTISGIDDALVSLFISKRNWNNQKDDQIRTLCERVLTHRGFLRGDAAAEDLESFDQYWQKLVHWGVKRGHETLLRFIDLSVTTTDLHRGAQDDLDAHGWRMENRIIRASTRLARFESDEKSAYYQDKILHPAEVCDLPEVVEQKGVRYRRAGFGYVREDLVRHQDVVRGTYPLSIPSTCIWKANLPAIRHIYRLRGAHSAAHPELRQMMEALLGDIRHKNPSVGELIDQSWDEMNRKWIHVSQAVVTQREADQER